MPQVLPLDAIPNQSFYVRLDGARYLIELKEANGVMAATIDRDGVRLVTGARCVAGYPLIPYGYLWAGFGNFLFVSDPGVIPYFTDFGSSCLLVYSSAAEIASAVV